MQPGASRTMVTLRVGSLVLPLIGSIIWGAFTYVDERQRAFEQARENVTLVRQYAERLVQTQTIMHQAAVAHGQSQTDPGFLTSYGFHQFLAEVERAQDFTEGLAVVALDGRLLASSRNHLVNVTFGRRDYLDAVAAGQTLVLDRLLLEPGGQDALVVVQPFEGGGVEAAIASAIAVEAIRNFLAGVATRPGESASLLREDGKLLVRSIPSPPVMLDASSSAMRAMQEAPSGAYQARAVSDGIVRLYAYGKLGDLPIYANFGVPLRLVQQIWLMRAAPVWLLLLAGGLFSFVLAGLVQRRLEARLAHEEQVRLRAAAEARAAQQQRFMRELNHRVKNNLAMVDSLIALQLRKGGQLDAQELRTRVAAIADVHDLLHRAADAQQLDLGELLEQVCRSPALVPAERGIALDCRMERGILADAGRATPLALVLVELVTNAVKHAFPSGTGRIGLSLAAAGDQAELVIADDGVGLPAERSRSSGIRIVEALVAQIGGTLTREAGTGTRFRIAFPLSAA